ncbi:MAG: MBL fold metallo-hydrolase [Clostridia bacterium]|nr:MBL fold metallo-hydrolase [Clostridia bacterium]
MILRYLGHAFFTVTLESGKVIAFDPYGSFYDYPKRNVKADVCLVSHHHHDHDGMECIQPGSQVIDTAGEHKLGDGVCVRSVSTWHDEVQGAKRGPNLIHILEAEGLRIAHAGDLGHLPDAQQIKKIGKIDVLLVPVGGYYTIDAETAQQLCRTLQPACAIPMHYRTCFDPDMPVAAVQDFLALTKAEDTQMPLIRLAKADMLERPSVVTLAIQE